MPLSLPLVKVCGLTRPEDAELVARFSRELAPFIPVSFCGFIFSSKSPRYITPEQARALKTPGVKRVGVFVSQTSSEIIRIMNEAELDYAQLHGDQSIEDALLIGGARVIRVLWPARYSDVSALERDMKHYSSSCAYFLLDAGTQGGGSGHTLDWRTLNNLKSPRPWLLAGGLSPETVPSALTSCHPDGLDLNSGVEDAPGIKSPIRLQETLTLLHSLYV